MVNNNGTIFCTWLFWRWKQTTQLLDAHHVSWLLTTVPISHAVPAELGVWQDISITLCCTSIKNIKMQKSIFKINCFPCFSNDSPLLLNIWKVQLTKIEVVGLFNAEKFSKAEGQVICFPGESCLKIQQPIMIWCYTSFCFSSEVVYDTHKVKKIQINLEPLQNPLRLLAIW